MEFARLGEKKTCTCDAMLEIDTKWLLAKWTLHHCTTIDATVPNEIWFSSRKVQFYFLCLQHNIVDEVSYGIYKKAWPMLRPHCQSVLEILNKISRPLFFCVQFYSIIYFLMILQTFYIIDLGFDFLFVALICHLISFQRLCLFASFKPVQEQYMR
jgi:hypothetical protein